VGDREQIDGWRQKGEKRKSRKEIGQPQIRQKEMTGDTQNLPMRKVGFVCLPLLLVLLPSFPTSAQPVDLDVVRTVKETSASAAPSTDASVVFTVPSGVDLVWVARGENDGYYRVIRKDKGPQGWVPTSGVIVVHRAGPAAAAHACVATLDACPTRGCAKEGSDEALANELKRRRPPGTKATSLSLDDFKQLQQQADARVGQGPNDLSPSQHKELEGLQTSAGRVSEGDLVRVVGFIAKKGSDGLHVNKAGESVNCQLKKPQDNDFHIPIVGASGESESAGIVVEMIPQDRSPAWSIDVLKQIQVQGSKVLVEGALSYDKVHYVDVDPDNPLKDEPERMSLWEIHPITKFLVCRKEQCDADSEGDWSEVE
jgi:hypothetical protein